MTIQKEYWILMTKNKKYLLHENKLRLHIEYDDEYYFSFLKNGYVIKRRRIGEFIDWMGKLYFKTPKEFFDRVKSDDRGFSDDEVDYPDLINGLLKHNECKFLGNLLNIYLSLEEPDFLDISFSFIVKLIELNTQKLDKIKKLEKIIQFIQEYFFTNNKLPDGKKKIENQLISFPSRDKVVENKLKDFMKELEVNEHFYRCDYPKLVRTRLQFNPNKYREEKIIEYIIKFKKKNNTLPFGKHNIDDFEVEFK